MSAASVITWIIWLFLCGVVASANDSEYGDFEYDDSEYDSEYSNLAAFFGASLITPNKTHITLELHTNSTMTCTSKKPISWRPFEGFSGIYQTTYLETPENERPYESTIHLINISHYYVGGYYCINNDSIHEKNLENLKTDFKIAEIYVYVNDVNNLLVDVKYPNITGFENDDIVIPCKPTLKNVRAELYKQDHDGYEDIYSDRLEFSYDPAIGYTTQLQDRRDGGTFKCNASTLNGSNEFELYVHVISGTGHVSKPKVQSAIGEYGTQGEQLTLNCSVVIPTNVEFTINWKLPNNNISLKENRAIISTTTKVPHHTSFDLEIGFSNISILNIDIDKDQGYYKCEVIYHSSNREVVGHSSNRNSHQVLISIFEEYQPIKIAEASGRYQIVSSTERAATWRVKYKGYPRLRFRWLHKGYKEISTLTDKYELSTNNDYTVLKIEHLELTDSGFYYLRASNGKTTSAMQAFELVVNDRPHVYVISDLRPQKGSMVSINCYYDGYPTPQISWTYTPCSITPKWPTCDMTRRTILDDTTTIIDSTDHESVLTFRPAEPGRVECFANNTEGNHTSKAFIKIEDIEEPFHIWGLQNDMKIYSGDNISIFCGASVYDYLSDLNWYLNDQLIESGDNQLVEECNSEYSYRKRITWPKIETRNSGAYVCRVASIGEYQQHTLLIEIEVHEPRIPIIEETNLSELKMRKSLGEPLRLICRITGIPHPELQWYKNRELITNNSRFSIHENETILDIKSINIEDEGEFKCIGTNRMGSAEVMTNLEITSKIISIQVSYGWFIGIATLFLILIVSTIYLSIRFRGERRLVRKLEAIGLRNFEKGNPESINPDLALDEQADLLPYDKKYEFPREKLKLGKQLGAGAFGVVVEGLASGISPNENETTVAVKMVKQTADNEAIQALVTELKIMVHLGKHLNAVNLMGAVTNNIANREVMVIVEYCRFGNVQNFLIKHREYFIDQINPENDSIDPTVLAKEQRRPNDSGYEYNSQGLKYVKPSFSNSHLKSSGKAIPTSGPSGPSGSGPTGEDNLVLSNNSIQPALRSNYNCPMRTITTTDLVCWSFQVARGMEYLTSRKVLHGDLAARNILLCDNNVVKICDFGLARSMYKSNSYKKKGEAPLPFKWLAIECIGDQVFSTYSDVWSFGITMWELFSLGKVPYPGMDADQNLYFKLKDGYRMEKPENATQDLYDIMLHCWNLNRESRPLFNSLEKSLGKVLENGVAEHYIDLNEPYLQMNADCLKQGKTDYLSFMGPPEGIAPSIPHCVNRNVKPNLEAVPDYLPISPIPSSVVFSPRIESTAPVISAVTNNLNHSSPKVGSKRLGLPEEMPMLPTSRPHRQSDSETERSPDFKSGAKQFINLKSSGRDNFVYVSPSTINETLHVWKN